MTTATTSTATDRPRRRVWIILTLAILAVLAAILWFTNILRPRPRIAIVTAGQTPYFEMVLRGAQDSAKRHRVHLTTLTPSRDEPAQTRAIHELIGKGYDGVAISVLEPVRQAEALAELAAQTSLVTYDSDSPVARRLCFVGTDNYEAGRMAAQLVRSAIPQGGDVIICVGSLEKTNAQQRRQGVIDELIEPDAGRTTTAAAATTSSARSHDAIRGSKYSILATLVDDMDPQKAAALASDAMANHPTTKCFVGLFAYNAPSLLKAMEQSRKLGQVKIVGFDVNEETLAGIEAGHIHASIMQDPYSMGYTSVRILGDLARGDKRVIPLFQVLHLGCDPVTKENVVTVRQNLQTSGGRATTNPS